MNTPIHNLPPVLTVAEVAAYLRLGRTATYELIRQGTIPSIRLGRLVRVSRDTLLAWLAEGKGTDGRDS